LNRSGDEGDELEEEEEQLEERISTTLE